MESEPEIVHAVNRDAPALLAAALAKAQGAMQNPPLDKCNPFYKSRYASLSAVRNACIPALAANGIALTQYISTVSDTGGNALLVTCETTLHHAAGGALKTTLAMPLAKKDAQGIASAATYARRIALQSVAGIVGEEDDDGNSQAGADKAQKPPASEDKGKEDKGKQEFERQSKELADALDKPMPTNAEQHEGSGERRTDCILPAQEKLIRARIGKDFAKSDVELVTKLLKEHIGVEHLRDIKKTQMNAVMTWLNMTAEQAKEATEETRKEGEAREKDKT